MHKPLMAFCFLSPKNIVEKQKTKGPSITIFFHVDICGKKHKLVYMVKM
jgi:hypothetical protein